MHLAPPQCAPDFIRKSSLAPEAGWVEVDSKTMQHVRYSNIFSLGDVSNLPTSKTGAAIRKQAPVVAENILTLINFNNLTERTYNGYTSCPLVTGYGKMVLAEFDYEKKFQPDPKLKKISFNDSGFFKRALAFMVAQKTYTSSPILDKNDERN